MSWMGKGAVQVFLGIDVEKHPFLPSEAGKNLTGKDESPAFLEKRGNFQEVFPDHPFHGRDQPSRVEGVEGLEAVLAARDDDVDLPGALCHEPDEIAVQKR